MRVLITGGRSQLGAALATALAGQHDVQTLDLPWGPLSEGDAPALAYAGDPRDRDFAAVAGADCDAIIHLPTLGRSDATALDALDLATRGTYNLLTTTSATRFILLSSLRMFERYPSDWRVNEYWVPRPTTEVDDLVPYLAEITTREVARVLPITAVALRLGEVADGSAPAGPRGLHIEDAVQAVERALVYEPLAHEPRTGWWAFHIPGGGRHARFPVGLAGEEPFGYAPRHDCTADTHQAPIGETKQQPVRLTGVPGGTARRVVIYGAGGPLSATTVEALHHDHVLRLCDVRPLEAIIGEGKPQSPDAPLPRVLDAPHETQVVDVTDPEQVLAAARGMDAIINCTVVRADPVEAFLVNMLGAYNVMRAAVACGIRRVVHTGPLQVSLAYPAGYWHDFGLADDVPARPGSGLYFVTKFLGQEICRIFAEEHDLEAPTLLFSSFVDPASPPPEPMGVYPFSVSWEDAAAAMRQALRAPTFPRPFEVFHILADLPHGKYRNDKAKQLLMWQPRDRLASHWRRDYLAM